jgi:hypothetical protein
MSGNILLGIARDIPYFDVIDSNTKINYLHMNPNSTPHSKRLKRYTALTTAFLATAGTVQAGIVYTDLDPDEIAQNSDVFVDMNDDGVWDFRVAQSGSSSFTSFQFQFAGLYGNSSSGSGYGFVPTTFSSLFAEALSAGASIGPASPITLDTFATIGRFSSFSTGTYAYGNWAGEQDKYFGVSFVLPDGVHYGWIRASVDSNYGSVTIKDFAYEDVAGVGIAAGDMGGAVTCSTTNAPQNPMSVNTASKVILSWDAVSQSVACQVKGNRITPPGPSPNRNLVGPEISGLNAPYTVLGAGTTWTWQVRCACSISPVESTPFSVLDTFSVPTPPPRLADLQFEAGLYPNPATDRARLDLDQAVERDTDVRITDLLGRTVDFVTLPADARSIDLDVSALEPGMYFVRVGELEAVSLEVTR